MKGTIDGDSACSPDALSKRAYPLLPALFHECHRESLAQTWKNDILFLRLLYVAIERTVANNTSPGNAQVIRE